MPRYKQSLHDLIVAQNGPLDTTTALGLAAALFRGLAGLHERQIIHRVSCLF
jgi:hypothetical protein